MGFMSIAIPSVLKTQAKTFHSEIGLLICWHILLARGSGVIYWPIKRLWLTSALNFGNGAATFRPDGGAA